MSFNFNPVHYKISESLYTNQPAIAPVGPGEPFYQEVQKKKVKEDLAHQTKKHCSIHSLNTFAGRKIVDASKYAEINNTHWIELSQPRAESYRKDFGGVVEFLKVGKLYISCTQDIQENGIGGPVITKKYIERFKNDFTLPSTSTMILVQQPSSRFAPRLDMEKTLREIEENPKLHRVIIVLFLHSIAFRKDQEGSWRVVDSMVLSQQMMSTDALSKLQPKCKSLIDIVHKTVPKIRAFYKENEDDDGIRAISYPSAEFAPETLKMTEMFDLPLHVIDLIDQYV